MAISLESGPFSPRADETQWMRQEAQVAYREAQKLSPNWNATEQAVNHLLQE